MEIVAGLFTIIGAIIGWFITFIKFRIERKDRFRMAALDRRLEAHQKAFEQCSFFISCLDERDTEKIKKVFDNAQNFYANYSLYLEKQTRKKFIEALGFINSYCPRWEYLKDFKPEERQKELEKYHQKSKIVFDLSNIIQKEVELEPIVQEYNFNSF